MLPKTEIQEDESIVIVGYGPGDSDKPYGERQFGDNKVSRILTLDTGGAIIKAEQQKLPDGRRASHAEVHDSGGACVQKSNPRVLVGIVTVGAETTQGGRMSIFTSFHAHMDWLLQAIEKAGKT
jgi:hypothetical protein